MIKLNFQQSLLQSSVSHDLLEFILICLFALLSSVLCCKTVVLINIFVETVKHSFQDSLMNKKISKEQNLFKILIFCNIQMLLLINLMQLCFQTEQSLTDPKPLSGSVYACVI